MVKSSAKLFTPFKINKMELDNRIVMAPMTRMFSPNGVPGQDVADYYRRRAENNVGLIVTEGTNVNHPGANMSDRIPLFYGDALDGWAKVVEDVHKAGGKIAPQLWHVGMMRKPGMGVNPDAPSAGPSGINVPPKAVAEPMTHEDVKSVIKAFADGARDAKELGFDAIEIHGAHGYLVDLFFWEGTNLRDDEFGGDLVGRTRFAEEIVAACRAEVGADFPIIFRYSQWKQQDFTARLAETEDKLAALLEPLKNAGVDCFHCSTRRFWEPEFDGSTLNLAGWTKKLTGVPTISVGSVSLNQEFVASMAGADAGHDEETVTRMDELITRMEDDEFDMIAVGRALLCDPEWGTKLKENRIQDFTPYTKAADATLF